MTPSALHALFANPPNAFRGKPFWSWNGRLQEEELLRQIHVLRRMGMGGFFMHSRTGLATEYLGEEWFRLINACADEAERLGMEAWLYDEDRWPSGTAGGMVTAEPRFRMKYLRMEARQDATVEWTQDVAAVFACRLDGLACRAVRRIPCGQTPRLAHGETLLVFRVVTQRCRSVYNGNTYVNTMNAEATARFLELTHQRYAEKCGYRLGRSIPGIFTDEPHRGALMDPFSGEGDVAAFQVPWTDDLPQHFHEAFGYDLTDHLPAVFLQPDGQAVSQVKWHFVELLMRLFLERFAAPYHEWCRRHGIAVTGHVLHEDSLSAQTAMCGSVMRYYEYMDVPGIDLLSEGNRAYWVAKQLQSAAAQLGRKWLLSELYGCTGWQMPFKGHKAVGDWQALFGINLRCHHLCWYTMEGEAKRDYPASIFHQSAWWRLYRYVEDYFSRLGVFLSQGERVCRLLVLNPIESVWCQVHAGWARYLGAATPAVAALERKYAELFHWLQGAQLDFDYADEAMLTSMGRVTSEGKVRVGQAEYDAVVVGGMTTIRSSTLRLLEEGVAAGLPVLFAGDAPEYVDASPAEDARQLARSATQVPWERDDVVQACERAVARVVEVRDAAGRPADRVFCHVRQDAVGNTFVMVLNTDRENGVAGAKIRVRAEGVPLLWDCWTGRRHSVAFTVSGDWVTIETDLEPAGERTYAIQPSVHDDAPVMPVPVAEPVTTLSGPFRYRLSEPNVCVLDMCEVRIGQGNWGPRMEVLKADQAIRKEFGLAPRSGDMLQPWYLARQPRKVLGTVSARFAFDVDELPAGSCSLAVERPDVFRVSVNGVPLEFPDEPERWIDICFVLVPIPEDCLRLGENVVEVTGTYAEDVGLEAVYLLGQFGVRVEGSRVRLKRLPERLEVGDITAQGLPFYSGAIAYELEFPASANGRLAIRTPDLGAACAVVALPDTPLPDTSSLEITDQETNVPPEQVIAWYPYEGRIPAEAATQGRADLHVYLTRRNTFGPLHQVPLQASGYGPGNWVTEGEHFSESHMLWPCGLLKPPVLLTLEEDYA